MIGENKAMNEEPKQNPKNDSTEVK